MRDTDCRCMFLRDHGPIAPPKAKPTYTLQWAVDALAGWGRQGAAAMAYCMRRLTECSRNYFSAGQGPAAVCFFRRRRGAHVDVR